MNNKLYSVRDRLYLHISDPKSEKIPIPIRIKCWLKMRLNLFRKFNLYCSLGNFTRSRVKKMSHKNLNRSNSYISHWGHDGNFIWQFSLKNLSSVSFQNFFFSLGIHFSFTFFCDFFLPKPIFKTWFLYDAQYFP